MSLLHDDRVLGWVEAVLSSGRQVDLDALVSSIGQDAEGLSPELARLEFLALASAAQGAGLDRATQPAGKARTASVPAAAALVRPASVGGKSQARPSGDIQARWYIPPLPTKDGGEKPVWRMGIDSALASFSLRLDLEIDAAPPVSDWNETCPMMPFIVGELTGYVQMGGRFVIKIANETIVDHPGNLPRRYRVEAEATRDDRLTVTVNGLVVFEGARPERSKTMAISIGRGFLKRQFGGRFHEAGLTATTLSGTVLTFPPE